MKYGIVIFVSVAVALALLAGACSSPKPAATPQPTPAAVSTQTPKPEVKITPTAVPAATASPTSISTPAPTQATIAPTRAPAVTSAPTPAATTGENLGDVLGRAGGIASVKYDVLVTVTGKPAMTQKVWVKKSKMRTEVNMLGQTSISLIDLDAKTLYSYLPAQNMAIKMDFNQAPQPATDTAKSILDNQPVVIGTETLDGKICLVVQYTFKEGTTKMWIWTKYGLPIRSETTTATGTMVMEYQNIDFSDIPDSMFQLPAGVQIQAMPSIPGLPNMPVPPTSP